MFVEGSCNGGNFRKTWYYSGLQTVCEVVTNRFKFIACSATIHFSILIQKQGVRTSRVHRTNVLQIFEPRKLRNYLPIDVTEIVGTTSPNIAIVIKEKGISVASCHTRSPHFTNPK